MPSAPFPTQKLTLTDNILVCPEVAGDALEAQSDGEQKRGPIGR